MKCATHPNDNLTKEDFYWRGNTKDSICKNCRKQKLKDKNDRKRKFEKMFSV